MPFAQPRSFGFKDLDELGEDHQRGDCQCGILPGEHHCLGSLRIRGQKQPGNDKKPCRTSSAAQNPVQVCHREAEQDDLEERKPGRMMEYLPGDPEE